MAIESNKQTSKSKDDGAVFLDIANALPQAIFWKDRDGVYLGCNAAFARATGLDNPTDIVGKTDYDLPWPKDEADSYRADDLEVIETGKEKRLILEALQQADGSRLTIETTKVPLRNDDGVIYGVLGIYQDVSEREQAGLVLRDSEKRLQNLVNAAPYGAHVYELQEDDRLVFIGANRSADNILGVDNSQFIGETIEEAFPALVSTDVPDAYRGVAKTGEPYETEQCEYDENGITGAYELHAFQIGPNRMAVFFRDITERKKAEKQLRQEKEFTQGLLDSIPAIFYLYDSDLKLRRWNRQHETRMGYSAEELDGKSIADWHTSEEVKAAAIAGIQETLATGKLGMVEAPLLHKDGSAVPYLLTSARLDTPDGPMMMGVGIDVTERKQAEDELCRAHEFEEALLGTMEALVIVLDPQRRIVRFNAACERTTGWNAEEAIGKDFVEFLVPEEQREDVVDTFAHLSAGMFPNEHENEWVTRDGSRRWIAWANSALLNADGQVEYVIGTGVDITERKQAEQAVQASEAKYRRLHTRMMDGFAAVDMQGRVTEFNESYRQMLQYDSDELLQKTYAELTPKKWHALEEKILSDQVFKQGYSTVYEKEYIRKDGTVFPAELRTYLIRDDGGHPTGMWAVVRDITERKKAEEALRSKTAMLEAQTNATVDGILVVDENGKRVLTNQRFIELFDLPQHIVEDEDDALLLQYNANLVKDSEQFLERIAYLYSHPQETSLDEMELLSGLVLERYSAPVLGSDGEYYGRIWTFRDITERKMAEDALRESEEKFAKVFKDAPVLVAITDLADGTYLEVNDHALHVCGFSRDEVVGHGSVELGWIGTEDRARLALEVESRGRVEGMEMQFRAKDGRTIWGLVNAEVLTLRGRKCLLSVTVDITARRETQEALRLSEEKFAKAFMLSPDCVNINRLSDGKYIDVNTGFLEMMGYTREEVMGRSSLPGDLGIWVSKEDRDRLLAGLKEDGEVIGLEGQFRKKDGTVIFGMMSARLIQVAGETCILTITRDITERKRHEEEQRIEMDLLRLVNTPAEFHATARDVLDYLRTWTRCEAVGLRLQEGDDYPYYETRGFSEEFVLSETKLCVMKNGELLRDANGNPYLECMCGNILQGRFDPSKPFFTAHGSFWTNSTSELLASTTEADRQARTRNRCNGEGYESVALIPLRSGGETMGLLQLNDRQKGKFTPELIALVEHLGDNIASALMEKRTRLALKESEENLSAILSSISDGFYSLDEDFVFTYFNPAAEQILGRSRGEVIGASFFDAFPEARGTELEVRYKQAMAERTPLGFELFGPITGRFFEVRVYPRAEGISVYFRDISERKLAEEALRRSEQEFRDLFENISDAVFIHGFDENGVPTRFLEVNRVACERLGYTREQLLEMTIADIDVPDTSTMSKDDIAGFLASGKVTFEVEHGSKNGKHVPVEINSSMVYIGGRRVCLSVARDITERRLAEQALRESELKYREIFASTSDALVIHDQTGRIVDVNERMCAMFGCDYPSAINLSLDDLSSGEQPFTYEEARQRVRTAAEDGPQVFEWQCRRLDGTLFWSEVALRASEIAGERRVIASVRDITERKLAEQALRESEMLYRTVIDSSPYPITISRAKDDTYQMVNAAFERIAGYTEAQIIGKTSRELGAEFSDKDYKRFKEAMRRHGKVEGLTAKVRHSTGDLRNVLLSAVALEIGGEPCMLTITVDVTERIKAEEALRLDDSRLEALLELSQRPKGTVQELTGYALEEAVRLTQSTVGYVAFVSEDEQTLTMHAWSKQAMAECATADKPLVYPIDTTGLWGEAVRQRKPVITNDYSAPSPWKKGVPEGHVKIQRHLNVPVFDEGRIVVVAGVGNKEGPYNESDVRQLTLLMDGMWRIIRRNRAEEELRRSELEKRQFYRDTIKSVTDGKLDITTDEDVSFYKETGDMSARFSSPHELSDARMRAAEFCLSAGMPEDSTGLFLTAAGEAMTNALKHAGGGAVFAGMAHGQAWICVADKGPGIAALSLPDATLRRGYSTKVSMGMGYSIMLDVSDKIMLSTSSNGTTVVLFKALDESRPMLSLEDLPDTWDDMLSP